MVTTGMQSMLPKLHFGVFSGIDLRHEFVQNVSSEVPSQLARVLRLPSPATSCDFHPTLPSLLLGARRNADLSVWSPYTRQHISLGRCTKRQDNLPVLWVITQSFNCVVLLRSGDGVGPHAAVGAGAAAVPARAAEHQPAAARCRHHAGGLVA